MLVGAGCIGRMESTAVAVVDSNLPIQPGLQVIPGARVLPLQLPIAALLSRHYVSRRSRSAFIILLLLIAKVELNPGPQNSTLSGVRRRHLSCGLLNVRSAVDKSALIHDLIESNLLDILIITETWITADSPAAVKNEIAPLLYKALQAHRKGKKVCGGGIAVTYRSNIKIPAL